MALSSIQNADTHDGDSPNDVGPVKSESRNAEENPNKVPMVIAFWTALQILALIVGDIRNVTNYELKTHLMLSPEILEPYTIVVYPVSENGTREPLPRADFLREISNPDNSDSFRIYFDMKTGTHYFLDREEITRPTLEVKIKKDFYNEIFWHINQAFQNHPANPYGNLVHYTLQNELYKRTLPIILLKIIFLI